jgi:DNA ligase-associated metallophosphoesterase
MKSLEIDCDGEPMTLLAAKAAYWPRSKTLLIADPHFGKTATFRHYGISAPEGGTGTDLNRLDALLDRTSAGRLIILGDFFHAKTGRGPELLRSLVEWKSHRSTLKIVLVEGNHDRGAGPVPPEWNWITHRAGFEEGPFWFSHEPCPRAGKFVLAGHLHPAIGSSRGFGPGLRLPCFWRCAGVLVLPAFGSFTGTHGISPNREDRVIAADGEEIHEIPSRFWR